MSNHKNSRKTDEVAQAIAVAQEVLIGLDCPRSLSVYLLLKYGEYNQIAEMQIDPRNYLTASRFDSAYTASNLLRKADFLPTGIDLEAAALSSFWEGEKLCAETNRRLIRGRRYVQTSGFHAEIHSAARHISKILGEVKPDLLLRGMGFGPGVSSSTKGRKVSAYFKSQADLEVTAGCAELGMICINHTPPLPSAVLNADGPCSLLFSSMKRIKGNSVTFVPKDAKTHRAIAIEPHVNIFVQKGIGSYIASRLLLHGIDLRNQETNGELSKIASRSNRLVTVDLSMASDTLSIELVRELLPPAWFALLNSTRSKYGRVSGSWHLYEKFSSMGNGFTFELESMIFYALASSVSDEAVSVYGDDIIMSSKDYEKFKELMSYVGFKVNATKSYSEGNFRESCGKHYFNGTWVTPVYIKSTKGSSIENSISLHNSLIEWGFKRFDYYFPSWLLRILKKIRRGSKLLVPPILGDAGFQVLKPVNFHRRHRHFDGWVVKARVNRPTTVSCRKYYPAVYNSFVTLSEDSPSKGKTPLRGSFRTFEKNVFVHSWFSPPLRAYKPKIVEFFF